MVGGVTYEKVDAEGNLHVAIKQRASKVQPSMLPLFLQPFPPISLFYCTGPHSPFPIPHSLIPSFPHSLIPVFASKLN